MPTKHPYLPDHVSPPGGTLADALEERGLSQAQLADRMGRPKKTINEIVRGLARITPETALELESVLGIAAEFWLNRERRYREYVARAERETAARNAIAWSKQFPLKAMATFGWIPSATASEATVAEVFSFFSVASVEGWGRTWESAEAQFRRSKTRAGKRPAVAAWLRRGEIEAAKVECAPFSAKRFRASLDEVRLLTEAPPSQFVQRLIQLCSQAGVALVFVPELPGVPVHAVTRWVASDKAVIQLSLYYKSDDHLWFSFFHEAAHVLSEKRRIVFLDDGAIDSDDERDADAFACDFLIPRRGYEGFCAEGQFDAPSVRAFAKEQGIAPGIVVGRLQHERRILFSQLNSLKRRFKWADES